MTENDLLASIEDIEKQIADLPGKIEKLKVAEAALEASDRKAGRVDYWERGYYPSDGARRSLNGLQEALLAGWRKYCTLTEGKAWSPSSSEHRCRTVRNAALTVVYCEECGQAFKFTSLNTSAVHKLSIGPDLRNSGLVWFVADNPLAIRVNRLAPGPSSDGSRLVVLVDHKTPWAISGYNWMSPAGTPWSVVSRKSAAPAVDAEEEKPKKKEPTADEIFAEPTVTGNAPSSPFPPSIEASAATHARGTRVKR
jgi:hypothetical protein